MQKQSYGIYLAIGIIAGFILVKFITHKKSLPFNKYYWICFFLTFFIYIGAKVGGILFYGDSLKHLFSSKGETTIFGSFLFIFVYNIILSLIVKKSPEIKMDVVWSVETLYCLPIQIFGKLGCNSVGCCYGVPTNAWYGVEPTYISNYFNQSVKLFPVQLLEALIALIIFSFLLYLAIHNDKFFQNGLLAPLYFFLYSIERFFTEFLRSDYNPVFLNLKMGQMLAISLFIISSAVIVIKINQIRIIYV